MASFKDTKGDIWEVSFSVQEALDLEDKLGLTIENIHTLGGEPSGKINPRVVVRNMAKLVNVLFVVCGDQAKERGLTDREFGRRFNMHVFSNAAEAFFRAFLNFTLSPEAMAQAAGVMDRKSSLIARKIANAEEGLLAKLESLNSASDTPASAE